VNGALESVAGVGKIDITANTQDFVVHYDDSIIKPEQIVAKLVAAGEEGAKVCE
jgi:copper chaperone CopZ